MSPAINLSMGPREWGMLLILSILWGGSFYFVGVAVNELPTFTMFSCASGSPRSGCI